MVATSKKNASVSLVFSFLYKIVQVCLSSLPASVNTQLKQRHVWFGDIVGETSLWINICVLQVFSEYFKELEEESIRDNFVIIYELMDELMDFGYPQTTDSKILQE